MMDNFQTFTAWEYLLIDVANNHWDGKDKLTFNERIEWATQNLKKLEDEALGKQWKERPLYLKACMTIRKAQQGLPTGHLVGFDAVCSGAQIMSAITGCKAGGRATGLIDTGKRPDAYTACTNTMGKLMGKVFTAMRSTVKAAMMTALYGSQAEPRNAFGDGTPELNAFWKALQITCPGASNLLEVLASTWKPYALSHEWVLPDGFEAKVKVMQRHESRIEVDELDHSTFTYTWYENEGEEKGIKNIANTVHSLDAYLLRSVIRCCDYDKEIHEQALSNVLEVLAHPIPKQQLPPIAEETQDTLDYYVERYESSGIADIVIMPYLTLENCYTLSKEHLEGLSRILLRMAEHEPFDVVTIHDDYKALAGNMNYLRNHYRHCLADLADGTVLNDILSQLFESPAEYVKYSDDLGEHIRCSNYTLT